MITMKFQNPDNPGLIQITWFNSDESLDIYLAYDTLAMLNFELQHFPVRQLAGPDRSGNFPDRIDLKHKTIGDGRPPSCDRGQRQR